MLLNRTEMTSEIRENMRGGKAYADIRFLLDDDSLPTHCRLFSEILLPPGGSIGLHEHVGETEIFYMLEGEARADDNGMDVMLRAGDVLTTGGGASHSIENVGTGNCRFVAVIMTEK